MIFGKIQTDFFLIMKHLEQNQWRTGKHIEGYDKALCGFKSFSQLPLHDPSHAMIAIEAVLAARSDYYATNRQII